MSPLLDTSSQERAVWRKTGATSIADEGDLGLCAWDRCGRPGWPQHFGEQENCRDHTCTTSGRDSHAAWLPARPSGWSEAVAVASRGIPLQAAKIRSQLRHHLVAKPSIFFEGLVNDCLQLGRYVRVRSTGCHWLAIEDGVEHGRRRRAAEGRHASCHFIKNDTQGKKISSRIQRLSQSLFRRHIRHRAYRSPRPGQLFDRGFRFQLFRPLVGLPGGHELCQAEIEELGVPAARDENILWFQIAMNETFRMGGVQTLNKLDREVQDLLSRQRRSPNPDTAMIALLKTP